MEIIPVRAFHQIRINLPDKNHPSQIFPANQDHFPRRKSSLPDISCESGSIFPLEIIPARHFLQIRINFPAGNHPCKSFSLNQDQSPRRKSSLPDISCESGSIPELEIIPVKAFHQVRINSPAGNHPSQTFLSNQDNSPAENASPAALSGKSG